MPSKIALPKIAPMPQTPATPKQQPSVQSQIYRNNRQAMKAFPMAPQRYPKFMGRAY